MNAARLTAIALVMVLLGPGTACSGLRKNDRVFGGWTTHLSMSSYQNPLGKRLTWTVTTDDLDAVPLWIDPSENPPPLSVSAAVALSRAEIPKYFPDVSTWSLEDVALHTLGEGNSGRWFYVVSWRAEGSTGDALGIPILMSSQPVALSPDRGQAIVEGGGSPSN